MLPDDFYKNVENLQYLTKTLYSDTDSVELCIPFDKNKTIEEKWAKSIQVSESINDAVINYLQNYLFKLTNNDPSSLQTFFKTEALLESIMFLPDSKKYYAYKMLVDEGKILKEPEIKYKNISIKSNLSKLSSLLLKDMIVNVVLNAEIPNNARLNHLNDTVIKWEKQYQKEISEYYFDNIGVPNKWAKSTQIINGMRAYNLMVGKEIFKPGSAGKYVYAFFRNPSLLYKDPEIDLKNLNCITVPYSYDPKELKENMEKFNIIIDKKTHWDKCIFTTTCLKVIESVKNT